VTASNRSLRKEMLPIRVGLEPMEGLVIAGFKGDPEFESIEPQVFDDAVNGKGMRVLRYRKDGLVDVYFQLGVRVDRDTFVAGAGLGDYEEVLIEPAQLEISARGVKVDLAFVDAQGRRNALRVREDAPDKRGFPMLAPVGAGIEKPVQLLLVYMPSLDLVRRAGSHVEGRVGDRILHPASLPVLLQWHRVWFIRYVARSVIATLNPPMNKPVIVDLAVPGAAEIDGMTVVADEAGNVIRISADQEPRRVEVDFRPSFPNLLDIPIGLSASGRWSIRITGVTITGGSYDVLREGERVAVELDVTEHWKPSGLPLSMEIFTRVVRMFRTWPSTYRWRGRVELGAVPAMSGAWERIDR
jgi:hypothetical protein